MPNFTKPISKGLDAKKRVILGKDATLALLKHAPPTDRGYSKLKDVPGGWHLKTGGIGETAVLTITESATVTRENLKETVAFFTGDKVWKIVGNEYSSPEGESFRVWRFNVQPTGEKFFG